MSFLNDAQTRVAQRLTWPGFHSGGVNHSYDVVLHVNGVRVILYPSGKLDILAVEDSPLARECEARIRTECADLLLRHVTTHRRIGRECSMELAR